MGFWAYLYRHPGIYPTNLPPTKLRSPTKVASESEKTRCVADLAPRSWWRNGTWSEIRKRNLVVIVITFIFWRLYTYMLVHNMYIWYIIYVLLIHLHIYIYVCVIYIYIYIYPCCLLVSIYSRQVVYGDQVMELSWWWCSFTAGIWAVFSF